MGDHAHYGYAENKDSLRTRLNRVEGQIRGIKSMVEDDKYCIDILTQLSAAQGALDRVALELVRDHAKHCLTNDAIQRGSTDEKADELVTAIGRLMQR